MTKQEFLESLNEEHVKDFIQSSFTESEMVDLFNTAIVDGHNYYDDRIYPFDESNINELFSEPYTLMQAIRFGNVDYTDKWMCFNGYGNLETISDVLEHISDYWTDLRDYLIENKRDEMIEHFEIEDFEEE